MRFEPFIHPSFRLLMGKDIASVDIFDPLSNHLPNVGVQSSGSRWII
jgi:hypothetical protein